MKNGYGLKDISNNLNCLQKKIVWINLWVGNATLNFKHAQ